MPNAETASAPSADNSTPVVTLEDAPQGDVITTEDGTSPQEQADPAKPPAPNADELVLELSKRSREVADVKKQLGATKKELEGLIGRHKQFADVLGLAKTDPMAFITKLADAAGLDVDEATAAYVQHKSGGKAQLTTDDRIARLEAEIARRDREADEARTKDSQAREKAEGDAAIVKHVEGIKGFAAAAEENFPLFAVDPETHAVAAFDLMVLAHNAGEQLTYAAAVQNIENTLKADYDKKHARISKKTDPTAPNGAPAANGKPPTNGHRPANATAAPDAPSFNIKSDDDIAADWVNLFGR
jgi:hypothetical protein